MLYQYLINWHSVCGNRHVTLCIRSQGGPSQEVLVAKLGWPAKAPTSRSLIFLWVMNLYAEHCLEP